MLAQEDRELMFSIMHDALINCHDRTSVGLDQMERKLDLKKRTDKAIAGCLAGQNETGDLRGFLVGGLKLGKLEEFIRAKMASMPLVDEIEVWLYFVTKLRDVLGLTMNVSDMLYDDFAEVSMRLTKQDNA